ncbi:MAG TPA: hypothetical protein VM165_15190 [Planctomycetaceae bacterium]|nr:hypothetical protein [Planctomycetaceae bacterium]
MADNDSVADDETNGQEPPAAADVPDVRLYVPDSQDWTAVIKSDSEKIYCYQKNPGEAFFHLIVNGEVYLKGADEKLCLRCALRQGIATLDRLHWQNRVRRPAPRTF